MLNGYARQLGQAQFDTQYSKYSNTNYTASGQDVHAITEILRQSQAQLDDVATELAFVESIMKRVRDVHQQFLDKRDQILASIRTHQGFVSCIRRLPPEILSEIFVRCLPSETYIRPKTKTAPLLLMGVCSGWRKVALGTPRLWCSLSVRPSHRGEQQGLFVYHDWLARARARPLLLAVDTRQPRQSPMWRDEVTELLQPYTSRTVRLHVIFDKTTVPNLLLKDVPMLEHLTLKSNVPEDPDIVIVQPEPRLRSLTLTRIVFSAGVRSAFEHYWAHLTQLRFTLGRKHLLNFEIEGPVVLTLLALCPHLQDLAFSSVDISPDDAGTYAARALMHSNLNSLDVRVLRGTDFFLDALTLPALKYLKIRDSYISPSTWRQNEFRGFVARSQCPLETLKIHGGQASSKEDQAEYVALIPTLKHVDLGLEE